MAAYTETKTYHTKAHMGMIDVTEDFRHAVEEAARQKNIRNWIMTGIQWRIRQRRSTRRQTRMKRSGGSWSITDWIWRRPGP